MVRAATAPVSLFAMTAWAGVVGTAIYLLNAWIGDWLERRWTQLIGAVLFVGGCFGLCGRMCTAAVGVYVGYSLSLVGVTLWP